MQQRTENWFIARMGFVTASRVSDVMAKTKTGFSSTRKNYMAQVVAERLTGISHAPDLSNNKAVLWGIEHEADARAAYEFISSNDVADAKFVIHPTIEYCGATPDGLVGDDGLIEIKCPNTATHIEYLLEKKIPRDYRLQMTLQLACTGRQWCDFVSYDPRLGEKHNLSIVRFEPSDDDKREIETEIIAFLDEAQSIIDRLKDFKS